MARVAPSTIAVLSTLIAACAAGAQTPAPSATRASESLPTATAPPTVTPEPSAPPSPVSVDLRPAFKVRIAEDGDINRVAVVGDEIWAPAGDSIVHVDTQTRETTTIDSPVSAQAADSFGATAEAVWIGNFDYGRVYRLDPTTGTVLSELTVPAPVTFAYAHELIWIGSGQTRSMFTIDQAGTKATDTKFPHELVAGDSAWGAASGGVVRMLIDSGERTLIDIDEPRGPGDCSVRGSSASVWLHCHGNDTVARLDPATNSVVATPVVGGPVFGGVLTIEEWAFFIEGTDEAGAHEGRIVRVDLTTNQIDRIFDLGPEFDPNPPVVAAGALWVPIAASGEIWGLRLSDLLEG